MSRKGGRKTCPRGGAVFGCGGLYGWAWKRMPRGDGVEPTGTSGSVRWVKTLLPCVRWTGQMASGAREEPGALNPSPTIS